MRVFPAEAAHWRGSVREAAPGCDAVGDGAARKALLGPDDGVLGSPESKQEPNAQQRLLKENTHV